MKKITQPKHSLEILEARIAPANIPLTADWSTQATHSEDGAPIPLRAGQGLSTGGTNSGDYLLYVEKGNAWIFTTDLNNNNIVDFNEITGIAAGDGLRLISFVDIHGDIVTNLRETQTAAGVVLSLSDSNNNPADDNPEHGGDGRVVLNSRIEKIELRTLTTSDITDQNGDGIVDQVDVDLRRAPSTHSIFGNIYAGRGFGVPGDATSGLLIDTTVITNFGFENESRSSIGSIRVGTAVSGEYFRFAVTGGWEASGGVFQQRIRAGITLGDDAQGYILPFIPSAGQAGASIAFVRAAATDQVFNLNGLYAGNGGSGAVGGDILDVTLNGDDSGGYDIIAGNGGNGTKGGAGGSILRFSDLGSDTSKVIIRSGSGGTGTTGSGGNAGNTDISNANFYGNFSILLGSGGDGFTQGGNGASLAKAVITQPVPNGVTAGSGWGTSHNPSNYISDPSTQSDIDGPYFTPYIGTTQGIDIDGDGFGDYVFSTTDTSQVVVMFGSELGTFRTIVTPEGLSQEDRIYLAAPRNPEAMIVADLNGDGRPDIVTASADAGNQAGISVFLSKWNDVNRNGRVDDAGVDQFLGFYDARFSPLPTLETGDPETLSNAELGFWASPHQVAELAVGDFDGDGANEVVVLVQQYVKNTQNITVVNGVVTALAGPAPVLIFMSPDRELDTNTGKVFLTGHFYADFGTRRVETANETVAAAPQLPYTTISPSATLGNTMIEATALSTSADHDTLIVGVQGSEITYVLASVDYYDRVGLFPPPPTSVGSWSLGSVDTNRDPAAPNNPNTSPNPVGLQDFAVVDLDQDGNADIAALTQAPTNFMVGVIGDGQGSGAQDSGSGGDQSGFRFGDNEDARGIKAMDADGDGIVDDFAVLVDLPTTFTVSAFEYQAGPFFPGLSGPIRLGAIFTAPIPPAVHVSQYRNSEVIDGALWDLYYPIAANQALVSAAVAPQETGVDNIYYLSPLGGVLRVPLAEPGLSIVAGDGGDSFVGRAGNGGSIGGKGKIDTVLVDPTNNISVTDYFGAVQIAYDGSIIIQAGNGGLGFSKGGNGGSITGVTLRDSPSIPNLLPAAALIAGDGGRGVSGTGGFGGDLIANSIFQGGLFVAGQGGNGKIGGRGGSVIGTNLKIGTESVYDSTTDIFVVYAGAGGAGLKTGGAGGSIKNLAPIIEGTSGLIGNAGALSYVAGAGGNAVSGVGGAGGSVINSSPQLNATIEDQIFVEAGRGGNGTTGGVGGSITTFAVTQLNNTPVRVLGLLAGHGGTGTTGAGGKGGSVSAVDVKTAGNSSIVFFPLPTDPNAIVPPPLHSYSRILAGNGGESTGARGGDGGVVSSVVSGATLGTIAIVSGAGGAGLTLGGNGGNVVNVTLAGLGSSTTSKALVVAGEGGDARAFIPNPNDATPNQPQKSFGGKVGKGGNGGSINGFTQNGDTGAHLDLIAGNGGSTVNYGTIKDKKPNVGRGGSVSNIKVNGNIGNVNAAVPIKSYNDIFADETMQDFVETRIRVGVAVIETLSDIDGNVGIVVGSAGRNKAVVVDPLGAPYDYVSQPAQNAKNGDLLNVRASEIMSAVAGSVDRLAAIQSAKNIAVNPNTKVGTDKNPTNSFDYLYPDGLDTDVNGVPLDNPVRDGRLVDGAFIAKVLVTNPPLQGRIFAF